MSLRRAALGDEPLQHMLFKAVRAPEFLASGWPIGELANLLENQSRLQIDHYRRAYPKAAWLLIWLGSAFAGRMILAPMAGKLHLVDISLLPSCRGQGHGTALIHAAQEAAAALNLVLSLNVRPGNPARSLYERLGFRVIAETDAEATMQWVPPHLAGDTINKTARRSGKSRRADARGNT